MACGTESPASRVPSLNPSEKLARAVTSGTDAKVCRKSDKVPASVFVQEGNWELSVDRIDHMSDTEAVQQGQLIAKKRTPKRTFHGWGLIEVQFVKDLGFKAVKSPQSGHLGHADIQLLASAATDNIVHRDYAGKLARKAKWRESPA